MATAVSGLVSYLGTAQGAITAASTAYSLNRENEAGSATKKANRSEAGLAAAENARNRRQSVVAARRARAQTIAQGENQGVSGSSSVAGAAGSAIQQGASAVNFSNQRESFDRSRFNAINSFNRAQEQISTGRSVSGVLKSFYKPQG